jgi:hydroxymethylbilane synthase
MHQIRVATRTSALAMIQAKAVVDGLTAAGVNAEIVGVTTRGDKMLDRSLASIGGDGAFTKELEASLIDGRADVAVHSLKDLPTDLAPGLRIGAVLEREDARDVLVSRANAYHDLGALPRGAAIGTSSLRRKAMVSIARPDLDLRDLRGNVDTRVKKVLGGDLDAAVIALAGVKRLGLTEAIGGGSPLPLDEFVPAVGQGAICAQCRANDERTATALAPLNHAPTALATSMERALLSRMGGGCLVPIGAHATVAGGRWRIHAIVVALDGSSNVRSSADGMVTTEAEALDAAVTLADEMLAAGGRDLIARFRAAIAGER